MVTIIKAVDVIGGPEAKAASHAALSRLETPADVRQIEGWLAELSVIVARRKDDQFTENLRLEAYASRLRQYPADVAREAVLGRSWKFWPAWSELEKICDQLSAPRRAMLKALAEPISDDASSKSGDRISAERAAEIMREIWGSERAGQ